MLKDILSSFLEYFKINSQSFFLKEKRGIKWAAVGYVLFLILTFIIGWSLINHSIRYINNFLHISYGIDDITALNSFIIVNLQVAIRAMIIIGVLAFLKYVLLILCAPIIYVVICSVLNQKGSMSDFREHSKLSLYIIFFHGKWDLIYFVFAFFISFIPVVGIAVPLAFLVLQSYYIGNILLLLMYRTKFVPNMPIVKVKKISHQTTGFSLGIGLGFTLLQCIPLVGMYIAPIAMLVVGNIILNKEKNIQYE